MDSVFIHACTGLLVRFIQAVLAAVKPHTHTHPNSVRTDVGLQVTGVELRGGVAEVAVAEMQVASVGLRFVNAKTGEVREDGGTRPDVVLRHLTTRPGRVSSCLALALPPSFSCLSAHWRCQVQPEHVHGGVACSLVPAGLARLCNKRPAAVEISFWSHTILAAGLQ